jgi:hypothetical protein
MVWVFAVFVGIIAWVRYADYGRYLVNGAACQLTGCSKTGMVAAGWIVVVTPAVLLTFAVRMWRAANLIGQIGVALACTVTAGTAALFIPKDDTYGPFIDGPGADQLATGLSWALAGALLAGAAVGAAAWHSSRLRRLKAPRHHGVAYAVAAVVLLASLPIAIGRARETNLSARQVFPESTLAMNNDLLRRESVADQQGCDGVLPDNALLNKHECLLTMKAVFSTDDSDAVAHFWAVLYRNEATATAVLNKLPKDVTPVGVTGKAVTVTSMSRSWVLIGAAAHADGRPIDSADRRWVGWPLQQVTYRFIGVQGGRLMDPSPTVELGPRIP